MRFHILDTDACPAKRPQSVLCNAHVLVVAMQQRDDYANNGPKGKGYHCHTSAKLTLAYLSRNACQTQDVCVLT